MNNEIAKRYRLCSNCSDRILSGGCDGKCKEYWKYVGATEQKAIDEEVRLKKSDDMTDAEYNRETAFADWYCINGKSTPTFSEAIEWSRKEMLDEVCNWLSNYLVVEHEVLTKAGFESVINELRKVMEENRL